MSCSDCINHSIGSVEFFSQVFPGGASDNILPISGTFELTLSCNVRCKHCYILYPGATNGEMNTEQCKVILKKLADAGVVFLLLTGGEIFTRPDFREIYLYAKQLGLILALYSNATLIDEDTVAFLKQYPPRIIEVTIYGHTEETYEAVTGVKGSFKRFRRGVKLMTEAGLNVALKTIVLKTNKHEFTQIRDWVESQGIRFRYDTTINPKIDRNRDPLLERLSPREVVEIEKLDAKSQERIAYFRENIQTVMGKPDREDLFRCGSGIRTFHVDPTGMMHPCMLWRVNPYNLLENDLDENWRKHITAYRSQRHENSGCSGCSNRGACNTCPAQALLEMNDPTRNLPFHCEVAQERRSAFGEPKIHQFEIV